MKFTGTITWVSQIVTGTSKNTGKVWSKQEYELLYDNSNAEYPKSIIFAVMGDRINEFAIRQGATYELEIDFESREWNGRRFMNASAWQCSLVAGAPAVPVNAAPQSSAPIPEQAEGDLPF